MREDIKPRYEILFSDLKNHMIGDYLISREFKMVMSQNGYYEWWQNIYEQIKENRRYFSLGMDHYRGDNIDTLAIVLNESHETEKIEDVITLVISSFIENKKTNENFSDIVEAMTVAEFSETAISEVKKAFDKHKSLNLPEKVIYESTSSKNTSSSKSNKKDIFIVHGHNEELKEKVARTIEKLKLRPVILHEQSNEGKTIIEKFEKH